MGEDPDVGQVPVVVGKVPVGVEGQVLAAVVVGEVPVVVEASHFGTGGILAVHQ